MSSFSRRLRSFIDRASNGDWARSRNEWRLITRAGGRTRRGLRRVAGCRECQLELRILACWACAGVEGRRAEPLFERLATTIQPRLQIAACIALAGVGTPKSLEVLLRVFNAERDVEVRKAALYAVGRIGGSRVFDPLIGVLRNRMELPGVRGFAAEALADNANIRAQDPLLECLDDPDAEVRWWSAFALGELGDAKSLPRLRATAELDSEVVGRLGAVGTEAVAAIERIERRIAAQT